MMTKISHTKLKKSVECNNNDNLSETMPCNICGGDYFKDSLSCDGFSYVQCTHCGLIFQNPQPSQEEIKTIYTESYFHYEIENHKAFFNLMKLGLNDINFTEITKKFTHKKRVLDIGCATGLLLNDLKQGGWETYGVEICEASAEYARREFNLNIQTTQLTGDSFSDNFFQVIHFSHLIEHVPNPARLLREVYRLLEPGGYAVITTPNADGLFAKIYRDNWRNAIAQHLFLFSKNSLKLLLEQTGFNVLNQVSWGGIPIEKSKGKIKIFTDKWIKRFNLGDVILFLVTK